LVQERVGNTLELIGIGKNFLNGTPAAQQLNDSIDKWDLIKLKSFCLTKEMVSKLKRTPTAWEKIFASYTSDKGLITRMYRELKFSKENANERLCCGGKKNILYYIKVSISHSNI
jgi:hypothetical protein